MSRFVAVLMLLLTVPALAANLPDLPGWKCDGPGERFSSTSIWQAIDGGAEVFLAYGFQELIIRDYQKGESRISIQRYEQGTPLNAFGIYHKERSPKAKDLKRGAEAFNTPPLQCAMWKGSSYFKMEAMTGALDEKTCDELLAALDQAVPGKGEPPKELALLPSKNQVAGSVGFVKKSYLGLADLENAVFARYEREGGKPYEIFVLLFDKPEQSAALYKKLAEKWEQKNLAGRPVLVRPIPYRSPVAVWFSPQQALGVVDVGETDETLKTLERLLPATKP